ncbi:MAG: hypothetical protein ACTSPE_11150 [Candidatus Thorarchaeota archaeon]
MFDERGRSRDEVLEELERLLEADSTYSSGHPVASMSTIPHSLGVDVLAKTLEKNAGRLHTLTCSISRGHLMGPRHLEVQSPTSLRY